MPTKTVTGNPITIYDALAGNAVSFSAVLEYVQSGSGDPSPTNVRPIIGLDGVEINITGADSQTSHYYVTLSAVAGTVYGGTLDITTGLLNVTHVSYNFIGTETWGSNGSGNSLYYSTVITDNINFVSRSGIFSHFKSISIAGTTTIGGLVYESANMLRIAIRPDLSLYPNVADFKNWLISQNGAGTPLQVVYTLATPISYNVLATDIPLKDGYNNITSNAKTLTVEYSVKRFTVTVPELFTYSPTNPYAGDTVTLTYSGDIEPETLVAVGVDTMTNVPLTKTGDKTWTFTMPTEDVGVTVGYKPYAEIELNQTTGGVVSANKLIAYDGDVVTLTLTPSENYEPQSVKVTKDARDVDTTKVSDTTYTFVVHIQ